MPLGELIGEFLLRGILELVFYGLCYWTGFIFLKVVSAGQLRLAPLSSYGDSNRNERKWYQFTSIWLHRPMRGRALKADCTILVGALIWLAAIIMLVAIYGEWV